MNYNMKKKNVQESLEAVSLYKEIQIVPKKDDEVVDNSINTGVCNKEVIIDTTCEVLLRNCDSQPTA